MKKKSLYFEIEGSPQGKARPRMTKTGHVYTPNETVAYEKKVRSAYHAFSNEAGYFNDEPLIVFIDAFYEIPKSTTKKAMCEIMKLNKLPTKKPDTDNIAKIICDALNGVAYGDDKQVVDLQVRKWFTLRHPRVTVYISEVVGHGR